MIKSRKSIHLSLRIIVLILKRPLNRCWKVTVQTTKMAIQNYPHQVNNLRVTRSRNSKDRGIPILLFLAIPAIPIIWFLSRFIIKVVLIKIFLISRNPPHEAGFAKGIVGLYPQGVCVNYGIINCVDEKETRDMKMKLDETYKMVSKLYKFEKNRRFGVS